MDKLDEKLFEIFEDKQEAPKFCEEVIKKSLKINNIVRKSNIVKKIVGVCAGMILVFGCTYAGIITYEKIWKEPKKYESYVESMKKYKEEYLNIDNTINENDEKEVITEEKAIEIGKNFFEKFELKDEEFVKVNLRKNMYTNIELAYVLQTNSNINKGKYICINAKNGEVINYNNNELLYKSINPDKITKQEARKIATDIYNKINSKYKDYELYEITEHPFVMSGIYNDMWDTKWGKNYDGAFFELDYIGISFLVKDGNIILNSYGCVENGDFENNPIVISENDAIKIAEEKDKKIAGKNIASIKAKIDIKSMNPFVYAQEKSGGTEDGMAQEKVSDNEYVTYNEYEMEKRYRKVWAVKIEYIEKTENFKENKGRVYYVDVTTGEIIGGEWGIWYNI